MKLNRSELQTNVLVTAQKFGRYKVIIGLVLVLGIYGFLVWRIEGLNNTQPTSAVTSAQPNPLRSAHIDKQVVSQLESLRDNSVNVKTLFNQARSNPFQ